MLRQARNYPLNALVLALTMTGAFPALAAQTEAKPETMVVVASHAPKSISDIPGTVWYVDSQRIEQESRGGKSLGEILAAVVPSLDVSSQGRTNYGQNLRGRAMLVMIDGVSLNSARLISRQLDSIDPFNIARIEVLSGATSIYGAGATGGVVNIVTKKGEQGELQFESYAGTTTGFNSHEDVDYKLAQSVAGGNDLVQGRASLVYSSNKAFFDAGGDMVVPDITQGSLQFNEVIDTMGSLTFTPSDNQSLTLLAQYYSSKQDSPYGIYFGQDLAGAPGNITGNPADTSLIAVRDGFESDRQGATERWLLNADYRNTDFLNHTLMVQASYRSEEFSFIPFIYGSYLAASEQSTDVVSLRTALIKDWDRLTLTYGVDGFIDTLKSNQALFDKQTSYDSGGLVNKTASTIGRYPGVEVESLAGFLQTEFAVTDRWSLDGGYRYQYTRNKIDDFVDYNMQRNIAFGKGSSADAVPGGTTSYNTGLFNLGTLYKLTPQTQLWANFSQGFDLSDPSKYYGTGTYSKTPDAQGHYSLQKSVNVADSKLQGIKTNSYEIGVRHDTDRLSLQSAAYLSLSDKAVKVDKSTMLISVLDDEKRVYGIEGQASYWLTDAWQLGANGHLVKSEQKSAEGGWEKVSVDNASGSKAAAWLGWQQNALAMKLQSQTLFDLTDDADGKIEGYTLLDLIGSYELSVGSLGFGVQNLLDKQYSTVWGQRAASLYSYYGPAEMFDYQGRGRTFTVNYQVKY
ncbi:TonB-dependent receptor [Aeromonas rivuli]|uniref:TonB-dependent receptor n=1 Tax=Aeromonas rivuli TaxID=648794 RepID=UPI0005A7A072|nr:TonB-dependent receptor [Aeromonas rivuli]